MLKPHEFSAGMLSSAKPLSLLLPRGRYEQPFLIGARDGQGIAVLLSHEGDYRFQAFPNAEACLWWAVFPTWAMDTAQALRAGRLSSARTPTNGF